MVKPNPLAGKSSVVFSELELRFARGVYKFGDPISTVELAAEFGVSQQPMRAALGQLRALGFVIITPQVGCRVVSPSPADILDFFRLFGRMEGGVASLAAERYEERQLAQLNEVSQKLLRCPIPEKGKPEEYANLVGDWHRAIRAMANSPSLDWRLNSFWNMSDFLLFQGAPNLGVQQIQKANEQREHIRRVIIARDVERAESLMFEHILTKPTRVGIVPSV